MSRRHWSMRDVKPRGDSCGSRIHQVAEHALVDVGHDQERPREGQRLAALAAGSDHGHHLGLRHQLAGGGGRRGRELLGREQQDGGRALVVGRLHLGLVLRLVGPRLDLLRLGHRHAEHAARGGRVLRRALERDHDPALDVHARVLVEALGGRRDAVADEDDLAGRLRAGDGPGVQGEVAVLGVERPAVHGELRGPGRPGESALDRNVLQERAVVARRFEAPLLELPRRPLGDLLVAWRQRLAALLVVRRHVGDVALDDAAVHPDRGRPRRRLALGLGAHSDRQCECGNRRDGEAAPRGSNVHERVLSMFRIDDCRGPHRRRCYS